MEKSLRKFFRYNPKALDPHLEPLDFGTTKRQLITCKEDAWTWAKELLQEGDTDTVLLTIDEKWLHCKNVTISGNRVYDEGGWYVIGYVVARRNSKGNVHYVDSYINAD